MKRRHLLRRAIIIGLLIVIAAVWATDYWVTAVARSRMYSSLAAIPHRRIGLLLGTSKQGRNGWPNLYYKYRIQAAAALYQAGKIDYVLVSGDNGSKIYDEPTAMQADLIAAGVPASRIVLDYAGFRTLDSIMRCREVFGADRITIISQPFHNERALFIAAHKDIDAIAFNARDVDRNMGFKTRLREKLARVKMLLDLAFNKGPRFYGPKVRIG